MTDTHKETHEFQAEVNQVLRLMIHSLYSNKEIFLRELISNASDACDKLRFLAVQDDALNEGESDLQVMLEVDADARTLTISDNGIGMTRDEVVENIGTIARSGTKAFIDSLTGDQARDSQLIGQFGVGFYSAFIVADKVTLVTRKACTHDGVRWTSDGEGAYTLEDVAKPSKGTQITLHLRAGEEEFIEEARLRDIVRRYSDSISLPIMLKSVTTSEDGDETTEWNQINQASALWQRSKSDISDEEYGEFYKHVSHDFSDPLLWSHNRVEGKLEYTSLLFVPSKAPYDLFEREQARGVQLYVQRVFIMEDPEQLMPRYLRFVRGVVDSNDLPLNVSREILQSNQVIESIRSASTKKVLSMLEGLARQDEDKYQAFWGEFGSVLKEGPGEDQKNSEQICRLLRFASTKGDGEKQVVTFDDYVNRMKAGQEKIYFITADNYLAAMNSPHLEIFKKKDIEVLLLTDRIDEWLTSNLFDYQGKALQSIAKGELDLGDTETEEEKEEKKQTEESAQELVEQLQEALAERVQEVKVTHRLTDSPACLVADQFGMSNYLERMLKEAGQANLPNAKPTLEINPSHPIVERARGFIGSDEFADWAHILFDQALIAEGGLPDNPAEFIRRINAKLS